MVAEVVAVVVGVGKWIAGKQEFCETQSESIMPDWVQWQIHLGEVRRTSKLGLQWIDGKQSWLKVVTDPCYICYHVLQEAPTCCGLATGLAPFVVLTSSRC